MNFAPDSSGSGLPTPMQMGGYQAPPPGGGYPPPPQPHYQPSTMPDNIAATLCYAFGFVTGVLFLFLEPYNQNRNTRFHAWQSIFVFGGLMAVQIGLMIITAIAAKIFGLLALLFSLISLLVSVVGLLLWIFLMVKAYQGERFSLPVIGPLAEQKV